MNRETLNNYFEGKATYEEEAKIRIWLESSPENNDTFLRERKMFDIALLYQNTDNETKKPVRTQSAKSILWSFAKVAAIVAVVALANIYYNHQQYKKLFSTYQTINVPAGQRLNIVLPDGTSVWLNAQSSLKYPVVFNNKNRSVILNGEAYFDVKRDEELPFLVSTEKGKVEVLGTKFNLLSYNNESEFEVALMDGKVNVNLNSSPETVITLTSGNMTSLGNDSKLQVSTIKDYSIYSWREGLLTFNNDSFAEMMHSFEKTFGVEIRVENTELEKYTFTGKFRMTDGVDYALKVLQRNIQFEFIRDTEKHVIYIK